MLGGRHRVRGRRVDDEAPVLRRRLQIDIVDPDAGPSDDLQPPSRRLEHLLRHLRPAPHDQRVAERDLRAELLGGEIVRAVDVREASEEIEAGISELLRHEDRRLGIDGLDLQISGSDGDHRRIGGPEGPAEEDGGRPEGVFEGDEGLGFEEREES